MLSSTFLNQTDDVICHGTLHKIADHDGVLVSFDLKSQKQSIKSKKIYDYKNADVEGLLNHIKNFDFENVVFSQNVQDQVGIYSDILKRSFDQFIPVKTVTVRSTDAPWLNSYTRLLLRKKNRNYQIYKKFERDYKNILNSENPSPEIVTRLLNKKNKSLAKARHRVLMNPVKQIVV